MLAISTLHGLSAIKGAELLFLAIIFYTNKKITKIQIVDVFSTTVDSYCVLLCCMR
jgi:hypothetical protein